MPDGTYALEGETTRFAYGPSASLREIRDLEARLRTKITSDRRIVKFCRAQHHIHRTPLVQLGTLQYYRECENPYIKDSTEGRSSRVVEEDRWQERAHSPQAINAFLGSNILAGVGKITARRIASPTEVPNAYVFCTSRVENPSVTMAREFDVAYDAFYEIADTYAFAEAIRLSLEKELAKTFITILGDVEYQTEKVATFDSLETATDSHRDVLRRSVFVKPHYSTDHADVSFARNREFRMAWMALEGDEVVSVDGAPKLISATDLGEFCV